MGSSQRPEHHLNLNNFSPQLGSNQPRSGSSTAATSPIEPPASSSVRLPIGSGLTHPPNGMSGLRTGSPNHDYAGRLYSKRQVFFLFRNLFVHVPPLLTRPTAHGKFKPKRASALKSGDPLQVATLPHCAKPFPSPQMATASPISTSLH
jgi:hypothetical protein